MRSCVRLHACSIGVERFGEGSGQEREEVADVKEFSIVIRISENGF